VEIAKLRFFDAVGDELADWFRAPTWCTRSKWRWPSCGSLTRWVTSWPTGSG
jgi:hypothetical protein